MESITGEFSFLQAFGRFALVSVVTIGFAILGGCSNSRYDAPSDARTRAAYSTQQRANISMLCQAQGDYSSLLEAVYANASFCVYKLADEGADVNERTPEGDTLFHVAIKGGRSGSAHSLLIKGADVNARDRKGWTPLHYAAKLGKIGLIRDMFRPPSDQLVVIDLQTPSGESAPHLAALVGDNSVGWFLAEQGADLELVDANGRTALHYGVVKNNRPFVEGLLTNGALVNSKDHNGDTSLHMAAREGNQAMCELLVTSGAQNDVLNADGKSPSQIAQTHGYESITLYPLTH